MIKAYCNLLKLPVIENIVLIGAGAKNAILRPKIIGKGFLMEVNTVLFKSIAPYLDAVGVLARAILKEHTDVE